MQLPFTTEEFLSVFADYNTSVFPMQIFFVLLAFFLIYLAYRRPGYSDPVINASLAFYWIWIGAVYHIIFFSTINKAAYLFGVLFIIQGFIFIYAGLIKRELVYSAGKNAMSHAGWIFLAYALIVYPLLGMAFGHKYPEAPTFGLPCPTTIFTFGLFLFVNKSFPLYVLIIPVLWSILGFSAALNLSIVQDYGLFAAGITALLLIIFGNRKYARQAAAK